MQGTQMNAANVRGEEDLSSASMDLTYITERIIAVLFPLDGNETAYKTTFYDTLQMLEHQNGGSYMIFNLSERRSDLHQLHKQVVDYGWPDALSPPLERLCSVCKSIDSWLSDSPNNVAVLHCKGGLSRMAVVIAAYIDYSNICAGSDQELDQLAMRHFYDVKLARLVQPSQRRYVHYFAGLLSGAIKINNSPLFLHKIIINGIPSFDSQVGCRPFIKIYQGMQPIYVSNVFAPSPGSSFICITLDPCLQLRSDILVKCFNKSSSSPTAREVIFRCQFHTCAVSNNPLKFGKCDLDEACDDKRFPDCGEVEFVFTTAPERIGKPRLAAEIGSSLERWNSYENFVTDSDEKTMTHTHAVSTSLTQGDPPKFRLKSEAVTDGSFVAIDSSSFQSNTVNQLRSTSVQDRVAGSSLTSHQTPSTNELEQLDEILRELLGEGVVAHGTSLAQVSAGDTLASASVPSLRSTITTESSSMQTTLSWNTSNTGVARSALVAIQMNAQPSPHVKIESDCETMLNHRLPEAELDRASFSIPYDRQPQQRETANRSASDHRRYASDSEDHASRLRERRSGSEDGARRTWRQRQLASENRELKSAHSAYYRSKQTAQSDTEDGAAYRQYGPSRPFDDSLATNRQNGSYVFQRNPRLHESTANRSYQYKYEAESYNFPSCQDTSLGPGYRQPALSGSSGPTSPVIPERGESSREAVLRSQSGARVWHKSNEVFSTRCNDAMGSWRVHDNEVEFQRVAPPGGLRPSTPRERTMSPFGLTTTLIPKLVEDEEEEQEEEVISLQPIGRGIQSLEAGSAKPSLSNFSGSANQSTLTGSTSLSNMNLVHQQRSLVHDPLKQPGVRQNPLNQFGNMQTLQMGAASMQQNNSQFFTQHQQNFHTVSTERGAVQSGDHADQFTQFHQPIRQQNFTERQEFSSTNHPSSADIQRNFMYESYLHQQQQGKSLQPGVSYNFPATRRQPYLEMQGDRDQSLIVSDNEGFGVHGERQNIVRSGQYSYETMQQQQYLQRHEQTAGSFGGIGRTASREFVPEMQRSPSLSSSVPFDRTQQENMRRLNSSMQNLLNTERAGSRKLTGGRTRTASVSRIEERGGGGGDELNPALLFVRDTSRLWHRENMTREEATAYLLDKPPGWFVVRNSNTYPGAYGLAVKVAEIPPNVIIKRNSQSELVRHFLIEPTPTGVQLKGNPREPAFGTLAALVYQHTLTPMVLPTKLVLPTSNDTAGSSVVLIRCSDSTTRLAGTYAAFNVLYINSIDVDGLSGAEAMSQAINGTFQQSSDPPDAVEVNLKVSNLGITLTDNRRKLFFRRHYPIESLTFCGFDSKGRRWHFTNESGLTVSFSGVFGFVARKQGCAIESSFHLFAELDPAHSSVEIVGTISDIMSGQGIVFPQS